LGPATAIAARYVGSVGEKGGGLGGLWGDLRIRNDIILHHSPIKVEKYTLCVYIWQVEVN